MTATATATAAPRRPTPCATVRSSWPASCASSSAPTSSAGSPRPPPGCSVRRRSSASSASSSRARARSSTGCSASPSARSTTTSPPRPSRSCATASSPAPSSAARQRRRAGGRARSRSTTLQRLGHRARQPRQRQGRRAGRDHRAERHPKQGLVIVDTPGMGGLGAGHAAATLAFLPFADGLILVSDASARAHGAGGRLPAPGHRAVPDGAVRPDQDRPLPGVAADRRAQPRPPRAGRRAHPDRRRVEPAARRGAGPQGPRAQRARAGSPSWSAHLGDEVVTPAKASAAGSLGAATCRASSARPLRARAGAPAARRPGRDRRRGGRPRAGQGPPRAPPRSRRPLVGARRRPRRRPLHDVTHAFRGGMREISRDMDERIEVLKKGDEWDEMTRDLQTGRRRGHPAPSSPSSRATRSIRAEVSSCSPRSSSISVQPRDCRRDAIDVTELWQDKALDGDERGPRRTSRPASTGIRGAQGGMMMFGMMGSFLPGSGRGADRQQPGAARRRRAVRRHAARRGPQAQGRPAPPERAPQVRQFLDDVQFEVTNQLTGLIREVQREICATSSPTRLGELQRTYTDGGAAGPGRRQADAGAARADGEAAARPAARCARHDRQVAEGRRREEAREHEQQLRGRPIATLELAAQRRASSSRARRTEHGRGRIVERLEGPLRVAIAGRVKAGKSTLLNALVGERLAPTDAGECTRLSAGTARASATRSPPRCATGDQRELSFNRDDGALDIELGGLAERDVAVARRPLAGVDARATSRSSTRRAGVAQRRELPPHAGLPRARRRPTRATPTPSST